jgi:hypothetical protein
MEKLPTDKEANDVARDVARAVVSAIPMAGGPLQVVFESVFASPLEKRKEAWLQQLSGVVEELQSRVADLTPEKLAANDAFITVALQASQIAIRNHQRAKLEALRNAVLNAGLQSQLPEDEQIIFVRLVDHLTPSHLRVLALLDDPVRWMQQHGVSNLSWGLGAPSTLLEHCLPELRGQSETYDQIARDLQTDGLLQQGQFLHLNMTGSGMISSKTTERGKRFIRFISVP